MSYDVRIMIGDDPHGEPVRELPTAQLVAAINSFGPFAERGITWENQRWLDFRQWSGLMIDLTAMPDDPTQPACDLHISYGTESDLLGCLQLAMHVAEALGATAWDLQLDRPVSPEDWRSATRQWRKARSWLRDILGG